MKTDFWIFFFGAVIAMVGLGVGHYIGDPAFHIRVVQDGNHETIFVLLALVIGFTLKDGSDNNSVGALVLAVFMAVTGFFMGGLENLESLNVRAVGFALYAAFMMSMIGTLCYLLRAIKFRQ